MGVLSGSVHTGLFVQDVGRMVAFYRDVLGTKKLLDRRSGGKLH